MQISLFVSGSDLHLFKTTFCIYCFVMTWMMNYGECDHPYNISIYLFFQKYCYLIHIYKIRRITAKEWFLPVREVRKLKISFAPGRKNKWVGSSVVNVVPCTPVGFLGRKTVSRYLFSLGNRGMCNLTTFSAVRSM